MDYRVDDEVTVDGVVEFEELEPLELEMGGSLTDRQAALFAAVQNEGSSFLPQLVVNRAEVFLAFLEGRDDDE